MVVKTVSTIQPSGFNNELYMCSVRSAACVSEWKRTQHRNGQHGCNCDPESIVRHLYAQAHTVLETERNVFRVEDVGVEHAVPEEPVRVESVWVGEHLVVVEDRPVKVTFRSDTTARDDRRPGTWTGSPGVQDDQGVFL